MYILLLLLDNFCIALFSGWTDIYWTDRRDKVGKVVSRQTVRHTTDRQTGRKWSCLQFDPVGQKNLNFIVVLFALLFYCCSKQNCTDCSDNTIKITPTKQQTKTTQHQQQLLSGRKRKKKEERKKRKEK